jgi:uncharacterized protein involved in outer membrane biogenesis
LALAAVLIVYALAGFALVPWGVRYYAPQLVAERLKRQASIGEVRFNPFLFTFEARDVAFKENDGAPIAALRRLHVDFEPSGLLRGVWTLADLALEGADINLVADGEGVLDVRRIADTLPPPAEAPAPDETPPRWLLRRVTLTDGLLTYADRSTEGATAKLSAIEARLSNVSNLPETAADYSLSARFDGGGGVDGKGNLTLEPLISDGEIRVNDFSLAQPWRFLRARLNLAEPAGVASLSAHYHFSIPQDKTALVVKDIALGLTKLRLTLAGHDAPILALDDVRVEQASFDLAGQTLQLPSLSLLNGQVEVAIDANGAVNWQAMTKPEPADTQAAPPPTQAAAPAATPWRVTVDKLALAGIGLHYADASRLRPHAAGIGGIGLELKAEAELGDQAPKVQIENLNANLKTITLHENGQPKPLLTLDVLKLEGGRLDLEKRAIAAQRILLEGGGAELVRAEDGTLRWAELFAPRTKPYASPEPARKATESASASPWQVDIHTIGLHGFQLAASDHGFSPAIAYDAQRIDLDLGNVGTATKTPISFATRIDFKQGGSITASGSASPQGDEVQAKLNIDRLDLSPLHPVVSRYSVLKLEKADLASRLDVEFRHGAQGPAFKATGTVGMNDLLLNEASSGQRFLSWKKLTADGVDFGLGPDKLTIKQVRIVEPGSKIAIAKDRTINLATIAREPSPPPSRQDASKSKPSKNVARPAGKVFPVTVERVRVDDGIVDFSDFSLVIPFATRIHDFDGTVTDISTSPGSRTRLAFSGRVDEFGEARVDGTLSPFAFKTFSDIRVVFENVEMTSLSPYSATFAGRKIKSGKLNLDLLYKLENSHLKSENKILLDRFTLGEKVESPTAVSLPLDLAVALLTDGEGKINASVPIEGDVDNPEFAYGKLVWGAFTNLIQKAVTAPFRALGALVSNGEDDGPAALRFHPGADTLPPPEREKLLSVARALTQRPNVTLTVHGGFDPERDGEALRGKHVQTAVLQAAGEEAEAEPLSFTNAKIQRALEKLAAERGGADFIGNIQAQYERSAGRKPRRIAALSALLGRPSEDADFYESLYEGLVKLAPLAPNELQALAERRSQAVLRELSRRPGFDPARMKAGKVESVSAEEGKVPSRLALGVRE